MNESLRADDANAFKDLVSVREAAQIMRVSESTVWRWINEDALPSYRVGRKRIYLKRGDLTPLLRPAGPRRYPTRQAERSSLHLFPMGPHRPGIDEVAQALALLGRQLSSRGAGQWPEAWEDLDEMRDQRSRELE